MADEPTRHNQAAYDQIAGLYAAQPVRRERSFRFPDLWTPFTAFYREPVQLEEELRGAGLQVMMMTEETSSRHWLKILACAA